MKQSTLLIAVIILISAYSIFAQSTAMVNIPLQMYDNAGGAKTLYFGLDPMATDSIDTILGESDLPPFPPTGVFEARWHLPENGFNGSISSYKDYRYAPTGMFTDTVEYRLKYQGADGADTMFFAWDFPIEITARLQDVVTGTVVNEFLNGQGVFALTNFSALDQMRFLVYYEIVPVELTSFSATAIDNNVVLNWTTATELNNQGFEIERCQKSNVQSPTWEKIGYVPGYGTTTEPKNYAFIDENLSSGTYNYRLKQIDYDGTFEYSPVVDAVVLAPNNYFLSQNYPNPFNPSTTINYSIAEDGFVTLELFNLTGEKVATLVNAYQGAGKHEVKFYAKGGDTRNLASGVYFYKIKINSYTDVKKMLLLQ